MQNDELTDEQRQVLARARRSFGISITVMLLGFMAIAFALVYRAMNEDAEPAQVLTEIVVPNGAQIISVVPDGGNLMVTFIDDDAQAVRIIDRQTGDVIRDIPVAYED